MTPAGVSWREQPFEAGFLGGPVWRLTLSAGADGAGLARALERMAGARLIACRIGDADEAAAGLLAAAGFRAIETLVTYSRPIEAEPAPEFGDGVGLAGAGDRGSCVDIGRSAFLFDRFHADPRLDDGAASALKGAWVDNGFAGRADAIVVARRDGRARGFVLCQKPDADTAVIDLIATAPGHQGRGLGRALVLGTLAHYRGRARVLRVGTQDANTASRRLYEATGFEPVGRHRTFHWTPPLPT